MVCRERVIRNFSRAPEYYERQARMQRRAAEALARMIVADFADRQPRRILELGCGTGFLTRRLATAWPEAEIMATDLSAAMLAFCQRRMSERRGGRLRFAPCDATGELPDGRFDLIAAGLMAQWTPALSNMLRRWREHLAPHGRIAFSALTAETFREIRTVFAAAGAALPSPPLPTTDALAVAIREAGCEIRHWRVEFRRERHASLRAFLRHLQLIGAGNAVTPPLSPGQLRRVLTSAGSGPRTARYELVLAVCEARP